VPVEGRELYAKAEIYLSSSIIDPFQDVTSKGGQDLDVSKYQQIKGLLVVSLGTTSLK
jgi:hypothetical protein